jgi:hypothetical protein
MEMMNRCYTEIETNPVTNSTLGSNYKCVKNEKMFIHDVITPFHETVTVQMFEKRKEIGILRSSTQFASTPVYA